jgi:hypothetical protein
MSYATERSFRKSAEEFELRSQTAYAVHPDSQHSLSPREEAENRFYEMSICRLENESPATGQYPIARRLPLGKFIKLRVC